MSRKALSICLFPFTIWYAVGVAFRNMMFSLGIKKQETPHITTISVGNLSTGGTGKTPHVEHLLELLSPEFSTALLSRGYKRKTKGYILADAESTAEQIGDEPYMMHRKFPQVTTAVSEKRMVGIRELLGLPEPPQVIVMDDAYQHRYVKPSINILLTEYQHPYYADSILPYGNLREFKSARERANIIIVTKSPEKINPIERHNILRSLGYRPYQKVFLSSIVYGEPVSLGGNQQFEGYTPQMLAVTGIAHPQPMIEELKRHGKVSHVEFADHHDFAAADLERMRDAYAQLPQGSVIITTEKDAARLVQHRDQLADLPIYYLPITVKIHDNNELEFDQVILKSVRENTKFLEKLSSNPISNTSHKSPLVK